jgi:hypothetical protein
LEFTVAATNLAQYGGFTINRHPDNTFAAAAEVLRLDSFNVDDRYDVQGVGDFSTDAGTIIDQILGFRSVTLRFSGNLQLSGAGFQSVFGDFKTGTRGFVEILAVDTETSVTTYTLQLGGYWSNLSVEGGIPIARVTLEFVGDTHYSNDIS